MKKLLLLIVALVLSLTFATSQFSGAASYISIDLPEEFDWSGPDISILKNAEGYYSTLSIESYKVTVESGVDVYVDVESGNDTTGDGSEGTPYASIDKAFDVANVENIYIAAGWYEMEDGFNNEGRTDVDVNLIGVGDVYITSFMTSASYSFSLSATRDDTYEYTVSGSSNIAQVFDKSDVDFYGGYIEYELVESIDDVDATPGSFFVDETKVYVHTFDDREPDTDVLLGKGAASGSFTDSNVYMENLKIYGGFYPLKATTSNIYLNDVELKYGLYNGFYSTTSNSIAVDTVVAHNHLDGFNYKNTDLTKSPWMIEIDVEAYANGLTNDETDYNNGSSMHNNYVGIRLNGEYSYNKGANVHDIDEAQSVQYGSIAHHSVSSIESRDINFLIDETTINNLMWLFDVESYGSINDIGPDPDTSDQITVGTYIIDDGDDDTVVAVVTVPSTTYEVLGLAWYWWLAIAGGVYFLFFTKKGKKALKSFGLR